MDQTINRGYPYPQCDPPLTKDASDIGHLYNLAQAVADDVQAVYDRSDEILVRPDSCRRSMTGTVTEQQTFPVFTSTTWDSTGGAMSSGAHGGILLVEPGWYLVGGNVQLISTVYQGIRIAFVLDGTLNTSFGPQADIVGTNVQNAAHGAWVFSENPDTVLSLWLRDGAATPAGSYAAWISAQQVVKL